MSDSYITGDHSVGLINGAEVGLLSEDVDAFSLNSALPVELWSEIFTFATVFHNFDPLAITIGHTTKDTIAEWKYSLRFRKGILRVCRAWRSAGRQLLYEHIVITEIPQLARIVQLVEDADMPGRWTRTIYVRCAIMSHWHEFYETHLARLIASCPNMTRFIDGVVDGELNHGVYRPLPPMIYRALATPRSVGLHALDMARDDGVDIGLLLLLAPTLSALSLQGIYLEIIDDQPAHQWILCMPLLVHLEVRHPEPNDSPQSLDRASSSVLKRPICPQIEWVIPRLRSLAMRTVTMGGGIMVNPDERRFMLNCGPNLIELDLLDDGDVQHLQLHHFLEFCQNVQTLALNVHHYVRYELPRPHMSLTKLIIRDSSSHWNIFKGHYSLFSLLEEGLPSLESIRFLSVVYSNPTRLGDEDPIPEEPTGERWVSWRYWVLDFKRRGIRLENLYGNVIRLRDYFVEDWECDTQMEAVLDSTAESSDSDDKYEVMSVDHDSDDWYDYDSDSEDSSRERDPSYHWKDLGDLAYESESDVEETSYTVDEVGALEIFSRTAAVVPPPAPGPTWDPRTTIYFPTTEQRD